MDSFRLLLDNVISDLNMKYGFEFEAADFKPELVFSYGDIELPKVPGKRDGEDKGTGHSKMFWDNKHKVWLPKDMFNATRSLSNDKVNIKALSADDKKILLDKIESIKGELDVTSFATEASKLFQKAFDVAEDINDKKENEESTLDKIRKEIKEALRKYVSENATAIDSRNKVIKEVDTAFGSDIAQSLKRVILRGKTTSKIKEVINDAVKDKADTEFEPEYDENKKKFDTKDIKYILGVIQKYHKEGVRGIIKRLGGKNPKYPKNLLDDIQDASEKFGDIEGVVTWLGDYGKKNEELKKWQKIVPNIGPRKTMPAIIPIFQPVLDFINKVKNKLDIEGYDDTFLAYTEKLFNAIKSYSRSNKRIPEFEWAIVDIMGGNDPDRRQSLVNAWRDAKVPEISKLMAEIPRKLSDEFDTDKYEFSEKDLEGDPDKLYNQLKQIDGLPGYVQDILALRKKPVKFEGLVTLDDAGKVVEDKSQLNIKDKEFISQVMKLLKEDKKETNREIRDEGKTPKEIKERGKNYREEIKFDTREELLKTINKMDTEELSFLEKQFKNKKDQISELRKKFREVKKLDETTISNHLKDLRKALVGAEDPKLIDKIQKLEDHMKTVKTMTDAQKEEIRTQIGKLDAEIEKHMDSKEAIKDMLSRFKDLDSWLKDIGNKVDDRKKEEKEKNRKPPTDEDRKLYTKKFHDAMVIHYLSKYPEIMYSKEPNQENMKKVQKLQKDVKELEDKKEKSKKDNETIADLKDQISKLEKTTTKVPKNEDQAIAEIKKLRERMEQVVGNNWRISPEDYKKYVSKYDDLDKDIKLLLHKSGVDVKGLQKSLEELESDSKEDSADKDTKKSSIVANDYTNSLFYKLEKLAHLAGDDFVKAELMDISERLKDVI